MVLSQQVRMLLGLGALVHELKLLREQVVRVFSLVHAVGRPHHVHIAFIDDVGVGIEPGYVVVQRSVVVGLDLEVRTACFGDTCGDVAAFGGELRAYV